MKKYQHKCIRCGKVFVGDENESKAFDNHPCSKESLRFMKENPQATFQALHDHMKEWIKSSKVSE
jgi:predicted  nucleic acid-binding Zn-ribbon protein